DTHELPNTLTWGPDGWLYGLNGVFNPARVKQKGKEHNFDAALWRYHPRTRDFDLFAEGTSNPWGLAFDASGSAFVSACVIDHLYHLAESGYYHRQAGAYPPFTWKIESIVDHKHQKAAYCGLALYDADVYPEKYRDRLFMGNIHGNCINVDELTRVGSSYLAKGEPDFLSANDAWFMPVSIKLGPDGCFYVLDWYDRYHCYQDANRDPGGIDRLKGRLYRIAYGTAPRAGKFDLEAEASEKLIERLSSPNLWWRDESRRLLAERIAAGKDREVAAVAALKALILDEKAARKARIHALWTLVSAEDPGSTPKSLDRDFHLKLLSLEDPTLRAWGIRAAGSSRAVDAAVRARVCELGRDPSPDVRLQAATAARKLLGEPEAVVLLLDVLAASGGDVLLPRIIWRNLEPLLESEGPRLAAWLQGQDAEAGARAIEPLADRIASRLLARKDRDATAAASFVANLMALGDRGERAAAGALQAVSKAVSSGEAAGPVLAVLRAGLEKPLGAILSGSRESPLYFPALTIAAAWKDPGAIGEARKILLDPKEKAEWRSLSLDALFISGDATVLDAAAAILKDPAPAPEALLGNVLLGLGKLESPAVAEVILLQLAKLPPSMKPQAIDLLTQRPAWTAALLGAVESKSIDPSSLNVNQIRRILALGDDALSKRVGAIWGQVRAERN
ncbi:MAG TPA: PVC-type heme-binding CxxCH protein, partial [Planctomycetota bacterium]|nr:PVC-type heme-binding CxxCH protein [Planctomycetota bacterium]